MSSAPLTLHRGCNWAIRGKVVHGHGRGGTQLGFPTANVGLDDSTISQLMPLQNWVYYGWGRVESGPATDVFPVVMSVGFNPHFRDRLLTVEAYFMHKFNSDFYDHVVRIISCGPVREQAAFTTLEALIDIIRNDCSVAESKLAADGQSWRSHPFLTSPLQGMQDVPLLIPNLQSSSSL